MQFKSASDESGGFSSFQENEERIGGVEQTAMIVDREKLAGEIIARVIRSFGVRVLQVFTTLEEFLKAAEKSPPSITILDARLSQVTRVTRTLISRHPRMSVAIVDDMFRNHQFNRALDSGAAGYLTKKDTIDGLERAFRHFAVRSSSVIPRCPRPKRCAHNPGILTDREIDIVRCRTNGLSVRASARALGICPEVVAKHEANVIGKLDVLRQVKHGA